MATILNQLAIDANTVTTITAVFGIIPHKFEHYPWETPEDQYDQIFGVLVHTIPMIVTAINYFELTDQAGHLLDAWIVVLCAAAYMTWNWLYTKETGFTIYPFLSWEEGDEFSLIYAICVPIVGLIVHVSLALITQAIRGKYEWETEWWKDHLTSAGRGGDDGLRPVV